ncbi:MAG TPA: hypothetical protein VFG69_06415 [Nannocystaceae bacterium]|nr:hypothetical protein [Nannocystaceae bacterium]
MLALALALVGPPSLADDHGVALVWRGAPGCPDEAAVRARLDAAAGGASLRVDAQAVPRDGGAWTLRLALDGPAGRGARDITATSCDAAVEAAAAVVGIVARGPTPDASVEHVPPPAVVVAPALAPPVAIERTSTPPVAATPTPTRARMPGWIARVGADVDVGLLPAVGATLGGGVGPSWRRARIVVGALHAIERDRVESPLRGSFSLTAGRITAGPVLRRRALVLAGEAGLELGLVRASGSGVPVTHVRRHLWLAATGGVELAWAIAGGWRLGAHAAVVVPTRRWAFAIGNDPLGDIGPVGGRFGITLGYEGGAALRNPAARGQP